MLVTGFMNDEDVLCLFFLQPRRGRARGGKTIIGRSRTGRSSARRAIKTRNRFPAAIATACSAWSTIFSITGGSSAVSRRGTIVPTASIGQSIRQMCAPTYAVYILAIGSTWWTYARLISPSSFETFPSLNSIYRVCRLFESPVRRHPPLLLRASEVY